MGKVVGNKSILLTLFIIVIINSLSGCISEKNDEEDNYPDEDIKLYNIGDVIINISCNQNVLKIHPDNINLNVVITNIAGESIVFTKDIEYRNGVRFYINTPSNLSIILFGYKSTSGQIIFIDNNQSLYYAYDLINQEFAEGILVEDKIEDYNYNWNEIGNYTLKMSYLGPITNYVEIYSNEISFEITDKK